jgi:multidrug efflux system membrane fusion protein
MNIVTEPKLSGKPIADKPHKRPVRMVRCRRWNATGGWSQPCLVQLFRGKMIGVSQPPPATSVSIATASPKPFQISSAVGDRPPHQVNVTSDVNGRITEILFTAGASVKGDTAGAVVRWSDRGDLANFKAQRRVADIAGSRQLAERQVGPQATDTAQAALIRQRRHR